ncbi:hypothetical protein [Pseudoxanthomonas putridarboris]|uniref:Lipoprotein n=1 Tax=Pseudoxanthomonas putridarboris TaxID=752605 RepID=A0ABU9IXF5_9GAMM
MTIGNRRAVAVTGLVLMALALAGCGDGLSKGSLGKIIDEELRKDSRPRCWTLQNTNFDWPVVVDFGFGSPADEPILAGAVDAGFLELARERSGFMGSRWRIDLTDKGRKAGVWDAKDGICIGSRRLHEVVRWTEPGEGKGMTFTEVTYTWRLKDAPGWVEPEMFKGIQGMVEPVESSMTLVKTSDGWRVP